MRLTKKQGAVIFIFFVLGVIFSLVTKKNFYYIPTSIVVGTLMATIVRGKRSKK